MSKKITVKEMASRIEKLEAEIADLKARNVIVIYPPLPTYQPPLNWPQPFYSGPTITICGTTAEANFRQTT